MSEERRVPSCRRGAADTLASAKFDKRKVGLV